jgi:aldehyde dehydrogenase (NAD+)
VRDRVVAVAEGAGMKRLYIGGRWVDGRSDRATSVINPATEEVIATVSEASRDDAHAAVQAARDAFDAGPWPRMSGRERSRLLSRFAEIMARRIADLERIALDEVGSTPVLNELAQVGPTIESMAHWADVAASLDRVEPLPPVQTSAGLFGQGAILLEPVGVVAAITPYNFPIQLNTWKIGPALAAGNTIVLKPSPYTPLSALIFGEIAEEAGLPAGVVNVITGGVEPGEALTLDPGVDLVTFTGSDGVGRTVMAQAAQGLKRVLLELGGKSANILLEDTDLDHPSVVAGAVGGFIMHAGQGCSLQTRILVHRSLEKTLLDKMRAALEFVKVGNPRDPGVVMGPLIRDVARDRVERYVRMGLEAGAELVFGGRRPRDLTKGYFFEPTLFRGVKNSMAIAQDEIFGPVGVVIPFSDDDEAVAIANDSRYGLAGGVWSPNSSRAYDVAKRLRCGWVTVNGGHAGMSPIPNAPFGGYKHSGIGRECGQRGLEEYMEIKTVSWPAGR